MSRCRMCLPAVVLGFLAGLSYVSGAGAGDPLKDAGLTKSGNLYLLPDETPVLDAIKALRTTKAQADKETRQRTVIENQIAAKRKLIDDDDKEWRRLSNRLPLVTSVSAHNGIVMRMNRLVSESKDADAATKDLETQAGKVSTTAKVKFVDDLTSVTEKADALVNKYKSLADDPAIKAALAKEAAYPKATLGPSPELGAGIADLKKWQSAVESEAIPLREGKGIHEVDALLNGTQFVMAVDTGATDICLPGEVAEKIGLVPTEKDQTVKLSLANGGVIEGKEMSIKTVRVGRFTIENVPCVVLQNGLPSAPTILGGSFLNHFIVNLDPAAAQLHLTQVSDPSKARPTTRESAHGNE